MFSSLDNQELHIIYVLHIKKQNLGFTICLWFDGVQKNSSMNNCVPY